MNKSALVQECSTNAIQNNAEVLFSPSCALPCLSMASGQLPDLTRFCGKTDVDQTDADSIEVIQTQSELVWGEMV
jgi:hypothetical protein